MVFFDKQLNRINFPGVVVSNFGKTEQFPLIYLLIVTMPAFQQKCIKHLHIHAPSTTECYQLLMNCFNIIRTPVAIQERYAKRVYHWLTLLVKAVGVKGVPGLGEKGREEKGKEGE
jgi:hypothetical protein